jgi:signal transduction histidine kinase
LIVSDNPQFSVSLAKVWNGEPRPTFSMATSDRIAPLATEHFDLAIVGSCRHNLASRMAPLVGSRLLILQIASRDEPRLPDAFQVPQVHEWPELCKAMAVLLIERECLRRRGEELVRANAQLEGQAALGRYMQEMRLNLSNALTSLLGNSELILAAPEPVSSNLREQLETIRNMGMRIHEILQRFSSLEKEMRLMAEHSPKKAAQAGA